MSIHFEPMPIDLGNWAHLPRDYLPLPFHHMGMPPGLLAFSIVLQIEEHTGLNAINKISNQNVQRSLSYIIIIIQLDPLRQWHCLFQLWIFASVIKWQWSFFFILISKLKEDNIRKNTRDNAFFMCSKQFVKHIFGAFKSPRIFADYR